MAVSQKHFRKRDAILQYLRSTDVHPSAETVYEHLKQSIPDLSLATVYRNLALFKKEGLVMSVSTVNGVERFDGNTKPHVHFACDSCDAVLDLHDLPLPEGLYATVESHSGCKVSDSHLLFTGTCRNCIKSH